MKHDAMRDTKNVYMSLAAVAVVMLLSAALVVPSSNAYAISQNGNGKSGDSGIYSLFFTLFGNLKQDDKDLKQDLKQQAQGVKQDIKQDLKTIKDDRKELKDFKEDQHDKDKCKPNKHGKYNKDCKEDQGGN